MQFRRLEIWELTTENDSTLQHQVHWCEVTFNIAWSLDEAIATQEGEDGKHYLFAEMRTYADCPVTIHDDHIEISGTLISPQPATKDAYGEWRLYA